MNINNTLYNHLTELLVYCDDTGIICYANAAAQRWAAEPLEGRPFQALLLPDACQKGVLFLEVARKSSCQEPTLPWELPLGTSVHYTVGNFRGYYDNECIVIIGQIEPIEVTTMQQELLLLTSELAEAQREQRRQNRALQQALNEQQRLLQTIHDLTAPAVPIWDGVLLLPIVGQIDSHRAQNIVGQLLQRVSVSHARYVIIDVSGIAMVDTAVAQHLIQSVQMLRLLGTRSILVGISPEIAQTVIHLGLNLEEFMTVRSNLQHAFAYVLRQMKEVER